MRRRLLSFTKEGSRRVTKKVNLVALREEPLKKRQQKLGGLGDSWGTWPQGLKQMKGTSECHMLPLESDRN